MPVRKFKAQIDGSRDFLRNEDGKLRYLSTTRDGDPSTAARKALSPLARHGFEHAINVTIIEVGTENQYRYKIWWDNDGNSKHRPLSVRRS
jgi:hypothetical protein